MSDLFGSQPPKQAAGAPDPRHRPCRVCGAFGSCLMGDAAFCVEHAPADFWPHTRAAGA